MSHMRQALEAVLFLADEAVSVSELAQLLEAPAADVERELKTMSSELMDRGAGFVLLEVAGGWRYATHPDAAPYLERFVSESRGSRLTQAALETLAIVAYRQPVSRGQIAEIRGVASDGVLKTLISRGLVQEVGRDDGPGQAILYGTTPLFMERLGVASLEQLPPLPDLMPDAAAVEQMESSLGPGV